MRMRIIEVQINHKALHALNMFTRGLQLATVVFSAYPNDLPSCVLMSETVDASTEFWRVYGLVSAVPDVAPRTDRAHFNRLRLELAQNLNVYPTPVHAFGGSVPLRQNIRSPNLIVLATHVWRTQPLAIAKPLLSFNTLQLKLNK
jgi:hypothetical protein